MRIVLELKTRKNHPLFPLSKLSFKNLGLGEGWGSDNLEVGESFSCSQHLEYFGDGLTVDGSKWFEVHASAEECPGLVGARGCPRACWRPTAPRSCWGGPTAASTGATPTRPPRSPSSTRAGSSPPCARGRPARAGGSGPRGSSSARPAARTQPSTPPLPVSA